jgi:hypothetical protein
MDTKNRYKMNQLFIVELSTKEMQTINGGGNVLWTALGRLIKKAMQDYKDHFLDRRLG